MLQNIAANLIHLIRVLVLTGVALVVAALIFSLLSAIVRVFIENWGNHDNK